MKGSVGRVTPERAQTTLEELIFEGRVDIERTLKPLR